MALNANVIALSMQAAALPDLNGPTAPQLFQAIGKAVYAWITSVLNVSLSGVTTGQAGSGIITGKLWLLPAIPAVYAGLTGAGIIGHTASLLAKATSIGLAAAVSSFGTYSGTSAGVAVGVDTSKVLIANPATLILLLAGNMLGDLGGFGANASAVARGLAVGIANQVLTMTGSGVVVGTPIPFPTPSVGTSPFNRVE